MSRYDVPEPDPLERQTVPNPEPSKGQVGVSRWVIIPAVAIGLAIGILLGTPWSVQ